MEKIRETNGRFLKGHRQIGGFQKGHLYFVSEEGRKKISESVKKQWRTGKRKFHSNSGFKKGNKVNRGRIFSLEHRRKISLLHKGKPKTKAHRKKISEGRKGKCMGEKNRLWKGGITQINFQIRSSYEYKLWRKSIFERDNYMCV